MLRKATISIIFLVLVTLQIILCIYLLYNFNQGLDSLAMVNKDTSEIVTNLRFNFFALLCLLLLVFVFIMLLIKVLNDQFVSKGISKGNIVVQQQKEIDEQNKLIAQLTNLYSNTVQYEKLKTEFFSNITHELKTPLSVILGAIQLIEQKRIGIIERRKSSKHLDTIKKNCYRLLRLINNLLDITRVDSGYIKTNFVNCNVICLIEEITQSVSPYAEQKNISVEFDTDVEEIISAVDIDKIERIVLNLLSNAIKFTNWGGKIWVTIESRDDTFFVSVKDTGSGIPPQMLNRIFERFGQVNNMHTREAEGSGIGLSLVKSFVELHGGNIHVISEENMGSEFIIAIPIQLCDTDYQDTSLQAQHMQNKIVQAINIEFSDIYSSVA